MPKTGVKGNMILPRRMSWKKWRQQAAVSSGVEAHVSQAWKRAGLCIHRRDAQPRALVEVELPHVIENFAIKGANHPGAISQREIAGWRNCRIVRRPRRGI